MRVPASKAAIKHFWIAQVTMPWNLSDDCGKLWKDNPKNLAAIIVCSCLYTRENMNEQSCSRAPTNINVKQVQKAGMNINSPILSLQYYIQLQRRLRKLLSDDYLFGEVHVVQFRNYDMNPLHTHSYYRNLDNFLLLRLACYHFVVPI